MIMNIRNGDNMNNKDILMKYRMAVFDKHKELIAQTHDLADIEKIAKMYAIIISKIDHEIAYQ